MSREHTPHRQTDADADIRQPPTRRSAAAPSFNSDRDRGFNPSSTAYSSTSRVAYPNTAGASVASSRATASSNGNDDSYTAPILNRNRSLADKMPKSSTSSRGERDRDTDRTTKSKSSSKSSRDEGQDREEKKSKRDRGGKQELIAEWREVTVGERNY